MNDKFDYVYDHNGGHWMRPIGDDGYGTGKIIDTVLAFLALAVGLGAVVVLFLCG